MSSPTPAPETYPDPALDVRHLRLVLGNRLVLDDVSLAVRDGEYLAVVGPNGAGKTSLLRCVMRVLTGWRGRVEILGTDIRGFSQRELGQLVAYVPQLAGPLPPFTVRELVEMARYPYQTPLRPIAPRDREIARDALARIGIGPLADRLLPTLSGGERQKALLAAALAQGGRILLLDEPTAFLDPHYARELRRLLRRLNAEEGLTVVEVTHDLNAAVASAHRVAALREGRVAFCGPPQAFADPDVLAGIFDCPFLVAEHPETGAPLVLPREDEP